MLSSGNTDVEEYSYPASYDEVYSIGGIFDDADGYTTPEYIGNPIGEPIAYAGYRWTGDKADDYGRNSEYGSTYNDKLSFVGPSFDVEVWDEWGNDDADWVINVVNDGTSFHVLL